MFKNYLLPRFLYIEDIRDIVLSYIPFYKHLFITSIEEFNMYDSTVCCCPNCYLKYQYIHPNLAYHVIVIYRNNPCKKYYYTCSKICAMDMSYDYHIADELSKFYVNIFIIIKVIRYITDNPIYVLWTY